MNIIDLKLEEKVALIGLLACMIDADGVTAEAEAVELLNLGNEMEHGDLRAALNDSREYFQSQESVLDYAAKVRNEETRELFRTVLIDLANADGFRGRNERALLDALIRRWIVA